MGVIGGQYLADTSTAPKQVAGFEAVLVGETTATCYVRPFFYAR